MKYLVQVTFIIFPSMQLIHVHSVFYSEVIGNVLVSRHDEVDRIRTCSQWCYHQIVSIAYHRAVGSRRRGWLEVIDVILWEREAEVTIVWSRSIPPQVLNRFSVNFSHEGACI